MAKTQIVSMGGTVYTSLAEAQGAAYRACLLYPNVAFRIRECAQRRFVVDAYDTLGRPHAGQLSEDHS